MKIRRIGAATAALAAGALVLTACANTPDPEGTDGPERGEGASGSLTVAETNTFFSFNPDTSNGNTDINSKIVESTRSNFYYINDQLEVVRDESFGTYEVLSEDPLTVNYTVNEGVVWSDGEPVDADDLVLAWAVTSGHYNGGTADEPITYFDYAGATDTVGLTDFPEIGEDGRSITLTYSEPAADWETSYTLDLPPAHVVAEKAGLESGAALIELLEGLPEGDESLTEPDPQLQAVAEFWNTGYDSTTLPEDSALYIANGPYIVSEVVENQTVTLVPNPTYTGAHTAQLESITMRTIGDATAAVQALQNGDVDVISPQSSADTLTALEALDGVTVLTGDQLAYDHIDLTFDNGGPFDPATYDGDEETARLVREAFLLTVPRQAILDAIVTPQKPGAEVLNSNLFVSSQASYADTISVNGSDAYPLEGDLARAEELLDEAGVDAPSVRILYNSDNPNRVNAYTLIASAAAEVGFDVVDEGDAMWGSRLGNGSYDAAIFGWINPGVGVTAVPQIFKSGGGGNYNGYSNPEVDSLADELIVTLDGDRQVEIQREVDAQTFADAYGLPLFQSPGVSAVSDRVQGINEYMSNQTGVWWNIWEWSVNDD